jgi:hypothetical protein
MINFTRDGDFLTATSPFWSVRHNIRKGGLADEMRVFHGTNTNLLTRLGGACVDRVHEEFERQPTLTIGRQGDGRVAEFAGFLCDEAGRRSAIRFVHRYIYTEYAIRHELRLASSGGIRARALTACVLHLSHCLDEYVWGSTDWNKNKPRGWEVIGPHCDDIRESLPPGFFRQDNRRPWQISAFVRGVEGVSWIGDSRQYLWDGGRFQGRGAYSIARTTEEVTIEVAPVRQERAIDCGREVALRWYVMLPNRTATCRPKYREVAIYSLPFPDESLLHAWADSGVNLIRIHEGDDYEGRTCGFWHTGMFPPYSPEKMKELGRFIKRCHALGMKIIPYMSPEELSPESPVFARHARDWYSMGFPNGNIRYTAAPRMSIYGALMCIDSEWGDRFFQLMKQTVDVCGFDGVYYDWCTPLTCHHPGHMSGEHNGVDGLVTLLENTRRWLGERLFVIHACGFQCWLLYHNIADQIVTLEEGKHNVGAVEGLSEYPSSIEYMGSASPAIVPNVLQSESVPNGMILKRGVAQLVHLNAIPYIYSYSGNSGYKNFGYPDWPSFIRDADGCFALYRMFAGIDFTQYRFVGYRSGWTRVEGNRADVLCSAYIGKEAFAVVSNQTAQRVKGGGVTVRDVNSAQPVRGRFGALRPYEVQIVKLAR